MFAKFNVLFDPTWAREPFKVMLRTLPEDHAGYHRNGQVVPGDQIPKEKPPARSKREAVLRHIPGVGADLNFSPLKIQKTTSNGRVLAYQVSEDLKNIGLTCLTTDDAYIDDDWNG